MAASEKDDAVVAAEFKREAEARIKAVCEIVDRARGAGFEITYTTEPNDAGAEEISSLVVAKHF